MEHYDPQAIVDSYTEGAEISRVIRTPDHAIMFQIERWFIERYLPKLRRCAEFIETRRDPENNLFLAGAAAFYYNSQDV